MTRAAAVRMSVVFVGKIVSAVAEEVLDFKGFFFVSRVKGAFGAGWLADWNRRIRGVASVVGF